MGNLKKMCIACRGEPRLDKPGAQLGAKCFVERMSRALDEGRDEYEAVFLLPPRRERRWQSKRWK